MYDLGFSSHYDPGKCLVIPFLDAQGLVPGGLSRFLAGFGLFSRRLEGTYVGRVVWWPWEWCEGGYFIRIFLLIRGVIVPFFLFFLLLSCLSCTFAFCLFFLCCLILRRLGYTSLLLDQYVYRVRSTEYTTTTIDPARDITKNSPNSFCCQGPTRNRTPFSPRAQPNIHPPNNSLTFRVILSRLPAGRSARSASAYAYANEPCKPWLMADTRFALYRTSLDVCHWVLVIEAG